MSIQPERSVTTQAVLDSIQKVELWAGKFQEDEVVPFLDEAVDLYQKFEEAARHPRVLDSTDAEKIRAIWIPSAPGTYFTKNKNDRYQDKSWSYWADRKRINHAFSVGRQLAEIKAGRKIAGNIPADLEIISSFGPTLIYNGRSDENAALAQAVKVPWLRIPEGLGYPSDKVSIIQPFTPRFYSKEYNLLDQVQTLHLPYNLRTNPGDEIGIVVHAAQGVRALYSLTGSQTDPLAGLTARMFLMSTPNTGFPEYPISELRAMVYYRFIEDPPKIGDNPHPYTI